MSTIKKIITVMVVMAVSAALFASGVSEAKLDFSSLDFSSASIEDIETSYEKALSSYETQREKLEESIRKAYEKKDVSEYLELRELKASLEYPVITEEITETLTERILNSSSEEEKKAISSFLYENSAYYSPSLTLSARYEGNGSTRTWSKTIVTEPGEKITLPSDTQFCSVLISGWGITEDEVLYTPGEEIEMPYTDTVLYAVLTSGISFTDPVTGYSSFTEESEADVVVPEAPDSSFVFVGWFDEKGKEVEDSTVEVEEGESRAYTAYWKSIQLDEGSVKYYPDSVPLNTQLKFTTTFTVGGNAPVNGLKLVLEETDNIKVLTPNQSYRTLKSGDKGEASFTLVIKGESGSTYETVLTATDKNGNVWSIPVSFTAK